MSEKFILSHLSNVGQMYYSQQVNLDVFRGFTGKTQMNFSGDVKANIIWNWPCSKYSVFIFIYDLIFLKFCFNRISGIKPIEIFLFVLCEGLKSQGSK